MGSSRASHIGSALQYQYSIGVMDIENRLYRQVLSDTYSSRVHPGYIYIDIACAYTYTVSSRGWIEIVYAHHGNVEHRHLSLYCSC